MTVAATHGSVEWLMERLYEQYRLLMARGVHNPVFVIMTTEDERDRVENLFFAHFNKRYGGLLNLRDECRTSNETILTMRCDDFNASIILMDVHR